MTKDEERALHDSLNEIFGGLSKDEKYAIRMPVERLMAIRGIGKTSALEIITKVTALMIKLEEKRAPDKNRVDRRNVESYYRVY